MLVSQLNHFIVIHCHCHYSLHKWSVIQPLAGNHQIVVSNLISSDVILIYFWQLHLQYLSKLLSVDVFT